MVDIVKWVGAAVISIPAAVLLDEFSLRCVAVAARFQLLQVQTVFPFTMLPDVLE